MQNVAPEINVRIDNRLYDEVGDSGWQADSLLYQLKASLNPVRLALHTRTRPWLNTDLLAFLRRSLKD